MLPAKSIDLKSIWSVKDSSLIKAGGSPGKGTQVLSGITQKVPDNISTHAFLQRCRSSVEYLVKAPTGPASSRTSPEKG